MLELFIPISLTSGMLSIVCTVCRLLRFPLWTVIVLLVMVVRVIRVTACGLSTGLLGQVR